MTGGRIAPAWRRRAVLAGLAGAGVAPALPRPATAVAPPRLETTRIRMVHDPSICVTPQYMAEDLLRADGFTEVEFIEAKDGLGINLLATGGADMMLEFAGLYLRQIDAGQPLVMIAGIHTGCFEIFGAPDIRSLRDLKGRSVAVLAEGAPDHIFLASVMAHVGLDPRRDVRWSYLPPEESIRRLAEGRVDAVAGFPPVPQELRARGIGRLVLDTTTARPWSQYFCCMLGANRAFLRRNPNATKAALRAILKGADACQADPDEAARSIVARGYAGDPAYARQAMRDLPYARWRELDPEDTVRFYGLRMHEAGMIRRTPNRLAAESADWRFLQEVRRELKG